MFRPSVILALSALMLLGACEGYHHTPIPADRLPPRSLPQ